MGMRRREEAKRSFPAVSDIEFFAEDSGSHAACEASGCHESLEEAVHFRGISFGEGEDLHDDYGQADDHEGGEEEVYGGAAEGQFADFLFFTGDEEEAFFYVTGEFVGRGSRCVLCG